MQEAVVPREWSTYLKSQPLQLLGFCLAVMLVSWFASSLGITQNRVVALWPAAGLTLWGVWRYGWVAVPLIFVGNISEGWLTDFYNWYASIANALAAGMGGAILRRTLRLQPEARIQDFFWIMLAGGLVLSGFAAVSGGYYYGSLMASSANEITVMVLRWFLSDVAGVLILAPLLFAWSDPGIRKSLDDLWSMEIGLAVLAAFAVYLVSPVASPILSHSGPLLVIGPVLLWLASRQETFRFMLAVTIIGNASLTLSAQLLYQNDQVLLETQLFIVMFLAAAYLLHATVSYQGLLVEQLAQHGRELEERVRERTVELESAKAKAEAADRSKSEFLANTSHEVRTPLNAILGMAEFLSQSELSKEQRMQTNTVLTAGKSLMALLNDIVDLSKVEAGKLEITPAPTRLRRMIEDIRSLWEPIAEEKGIAFGVCVADQVPDHLLMDEHRVKQCLSNMLSNAIKFTDKGSVDLRVSAAREQSGTYRFDFEVSDSGIGISDAAAKKLFLPFDQLDTSIARRFGGAGLGLAISRQLAQLMNGDLSMKSKLGEGSTFKVTVRVPLAGKQDGPGDCIEQDLVNEDQLMGMRVLVVEDNPVNLMVVKGHLKTLELEFDHAGNGVECLTRLATSTYDFVLLDVHMPVMDGIEAISRIRASGESWHDVPVIALTADAMSSDRARLLGLGMDGYASKPISRTDLVREIHSVLRNKRAL